MFWITIAIRIKFQVDVFRSSFGTVNFFHLVQVVFDLRAEICNGIKLFDKVFASVVLIVVLICTLLILEVLEDGRPRLNIDKNHEDGHGS